MFDDIRRFFRWSSPFWFALGRGLRSFAGWFVGLIADAISSLFGAAVSGVAQIVRRLAPWALGALVLWGLWKADPVAFQAIAGQFLILITIFYGIWVIIKSLSPKKKKRN